MKNVLVGQSGGPTAVINSSLAGVYETAKACGAEHVYGMQYGIAGVLEGKLVDLDAVLSDKMDIELLKRTPSSFLGSCRHKLPQPDVDEAPFVQLFDLFKQYDIGAVFYIGGNDSMDTISKLSAYGKTIGSEIRFIGVPKTIDNDLLLTDHTPGYGSAANYIATILKEVICDSSVYDLRSQVLPTVPSSSQCGVDLHLSAVRRNGRARRGRYADAHYERRGRISFVADLSGSEDA